MLTASAGPFIGAGFARFFIIVYNCSWSTNTVTNINGLCTVLCES